MNTSNFMSRRIYLILVLITLFSCNSNTNDKKTISIGFSQSISEDDSWRKSMDNTMNVEASLHPEIDLTINNANGSTKKQINDIEKMDNGLNSPWRINYTNNVIKKTIAILISGRATCWENCLLPVLQNSDDYNIHLFMSINNSSPDCTYFKIMKHHLKKYLKNIYIKRKM